MWISIFTALICFGVATLMFTEPLRPFPVYQPVAFYFLFEGTYTILAAIAQLIWPGSTFMGWVHCFGVILFAGYLLIKLCRLYHEHRRRQKQSIEK